MIVKGFSDDRASWPSDLYNFKSKSSVPKFNNDITGSQTLLFFSFSSPPLAKNSPDWPGYSAINVSGFNSR
jgi:hypothetical protein